MFELFQNENQKSLNKTINKEDRLITYSSL
jgi:hypothetical protein